MPFDFGQVGQFNFTVRVRNRAGLGRSGSIIDSIQTLFLPVELLLNALQNVQDGRE